jgi:hypothetical protein
MDRGPAKRLKSAPTSAIELTPNPRLRLCKNCSHQAVCGSYPRARASDFLSHTRLAFARALAG